MLKKIYTVRDNKIDAYLEPHFAHDDETAKRTMIYSVNDQQHPFSKNAEDYALYYLGEYDDITAKITSLDQPKHLANLLDLKKD